MEFSLVIPNLNGEKFLSECLDSLAITFKKCPKDKFELILVDNASKDNSLSLFSQKQKDFPKNTTFQLIINPRNLGFAGGVNPGIIKSRYDWVLLVNNDLTVAPNWFEIIIPLFSKLDPGVAVIYGLVLTKDGKFIESEGLDFHYSGQCHNINNGKPFRNFELETRNYMYIWGAPASLVIYKKDILAKIGNFDEDFFAYEEDVDVALRLFKLGYKTLYVPQAISYHLGSGTSSRMGNFRNIMDFKNWIYIIIKNFTGREIRKNIFGIIEQRLRNLSGLIKNTIRLDGPKSLYTVPFCILKVLFEIISHIPSMQRKRYHFFKLLQK